ncbi:DUF4097 family beta strand repeat-containing protein [Treponema pedis]|uniref:DUF4097 family beta strand repeat-containing protein n=1 Tax=Treponema pedis TaxID=409322 RepID=UPI0031342216
MTREQFLTELEKNLSSLNKEDRENTIQFYKEYFEDAGSENEQNVIEELGSPEKLAEEISAFHKAPYTGGKAQICKTVDGVAEEIQLELTSTNVDISESDGDFIEYKTENISEEDIAVRMENGKLYIEERPLFSLHKRAFTEFFKNISFNKVYDETVKRRLEIYVPKKLCLEKAELNIKLGSVKIKNVNFRRIEGYIACGSLQVLNVPCRKIIFNAAAGAVMLSSLNPEDIKVQSSAGSISLKNVKAEKISASTGAGSILFKDVFSEQIYANSGAGSISSYNLKTNKGKFSTGAGKINFEDTDLKNGIISTGAGSIEFCGSLEERAEFRSSLGKIELNLTDGLDNYFMKVYSRTSFTLNGQTVEIPGDLKCIGNQDSENRINVYTNFGKIKITTK